MLIVDVLGAGNGNPGARRDTHAVALRGALDGGVTLIDCPGGIAHKLARIDVDLSRVARVVLTHDHVDHVYGVPHLLHAMAIAGRRGVLELYGPKRTLETVAGMVQVHALDRPHYPGLRLTEVDLDDDVTVVDDDLTVTAAPARHGRPTLALRCAGAAGGAAGLSSDTLPSMAVAELCAGVDLLLHDCGGLHDDRGDFGTNHASARQAGEIAAQSQAGALRLTHLPDGDATADARLVAEAQAAFVGPVDVARDGDRYVLPV